MRGAADMRLEGVILFEDGLVIELPATSNEVKSRIWR
jgi:hypothetical protein